MQTQPGAADPPALLARRLGAFAVHLLLFAVAAALASRFFAGLQQETVPPAFRGADIDLCDVVATAAGTGTSICFRVGDTLITSTSPHAPAKILVPATLVMLANSVVLAGARGASWGMRLFGLRVVRRATGAPAGAAPLLVRWAAWIVVDGFAFGLVGAAATLTTRGQRRIGDLVAATVVVPVDSDGTPPRLSPAIVRLRRRADATGATAATTATPTGPAITPGARQWEAATKLRLAPDPQPGASRPFDDVASPPRPLT